MLMSAVFEVFTISAVIPFLAVILDPEKVFSFPIITVLSNIFQVSKSNTASFISSIFILAVLLSGVIRTFTIFLTYKLTSNIGSYLSNKFFNKIIYQPYDKHLTFNTTDSLSSMTYHLDETITVFNSGLIFLTNFIIGISVIFTLFVINFRIAIISTITILSYYFLISFCTKNIIKDSSIYIEKTVNKQYSIINEALNSIKEIILRSKQGYFLKDFRRDNIRD